MQKKVAIVTWIKYDNFGTFLQAFALQKVLKDMGCDSCILDDHTIIEEGRCTNHPSALKRWYYSFRFLLSSLLRKGIGLYLKEKRSHKLYGQFRRRYLNVDTQIQPLSALDERYDTFVCGSDQIWYPSALIFSPYYYLNFTQKKKIAYAPSIGTSRYPNDFIPKVKPLLERFDKLSVREQVGAEIIGTIVGREVPAVLDPTLLLEGHDWEKMALSSPSCKHEYVLCYFLTYNEAYIHFVVDYARRHSLRVVGFALYGQKNDYADIVLAAGPHGFLSAVKHANMVFTDSFHGTIFSLQFRKKFCTFKRFADHDPNNQNSRVNNLLQMVGLESHFVGINDLARIDQLPAINYEAVERTLSNERSASIRYLKEALMN